MTPSASLFRLGDLVRFVVIVDDPLVVLIHDNDLVALAAEPIGRVANTGSNAEGGMEHRDVSGGLEDGFGAVSPCCEDHGRRPARLLQGVLRVRLTERWPSIHGGQPMRRLAQDRR